ncbi:hypothetical protein ACFLS1_06820 [Verrucomicrobiota bacterium]
MRFIKHIMAFILLLCLVSFTANGAANKKKILIYGAPDTSSGADPQSIAKNLKKLFSSSLLDKNIDVQGKVSHGSLLMEAVHHPKYRDETIKTIANGYDYVVLIDNSAHALKYPEFHFEGIYQMSAAIKKSGAIPLLLMLWNENASDTDTYGEIAYRVGKGTDTAVIPAGYLLAEAEKSKAGLSAECVSYCIAVSVYTQIKEKEIRRGEFCPPGMGALRNSIGKTAYGVFSSHNKATHYNNSCAPKGIVRILPVEMPRTSTFRIIQTGTSTEAGWKRHISPLLKAAKYSPQITGLRNDDPRRCFSNTDLEKAKPFFKENPDSYLISFARSYDISSEEIVGDNQKYLQCQIYDKAEPLSKKTYSLNEVSSMIFHHSQIIAKYNSAIKNNLSMIPLHIACARIYIERPDMILSEDGTHMRFPFLYMLAGMSYTARTGKKPVTEGLDKDSVFTINVGYKTITQLANLSRTGSYIPER